MCVYIHLFNVWWSRAPRFWHASACRNRGDGSFAQFRLPDCDVNGQPAVDTRSKQARIAGPQLAFHSSEARLYVLHYNGVLYECSFCLDHDSKNGTQDCSLAGASTWFAVRPDFRVQGASHQLATVAGGTSEDGDDGAEEWQIL